MNQAVQNKIDSILDRIKEPETFRSISELNLVRKVTFSEKQKEIHVVMDIEQPRLSCFVCGVVTEKIRSSIERDIKEEFEKEFPGFKCLLS